MWPLFLLAMVGGFCGLSLVAWRDVPPVLGTAAVLLTLAALAAALLR